MATHHITCVQLGEVGFGLRGPSGVGKSDLALRLIDAGAKLISDDYTDLSTQKSQLIANPPDNIKGRMEVRGIGIVPMAHVKSAPLHMIIDLVSEDEIERLPEPSWCEVEGIKLASVKIEPRAPSAVAKIQLLADLIAKDQWPPDSKS